MILCCGEALIDMIPTPTQDGREGFVPHCGGAVFNTAIALGRLGAKAGLLTGLSTDFFGKQLADGLRESNVDLSMSIFSERPSTLAFVKIENGQASYSFFDESSAGRMIHPEDLPALPPEVSTVFVGGISLIEEPCGKAYESLVEREAEKRVIVCDPNIRASFIRDEEKHRKRLDLIFRKADIVKLSDEDANWIIPESLPLEEKVRSVLAAGAEIVILTRGGEGATAITRSGRSLAIPSREVKVVDTVGAGDSFNAGFMASLERQGLLDKERLAGASGEQISEALEKGNQVAAITVSRSGANPPWAGELA